MVYDELIDRVGLGDIRDKVLAGERLQADDGLRLYACDEFPILGYLANIVRERKNGNATYYVRNQHINYKTTQSIYFFSINVSHCIMR